MKENKAKNKSFILLVFCVIFLFLFTFNVTSSRYMGTISGEVSDIVAIPVLSLEKPSFSYTPEKMLPGYTDESDFYVSNYDDQNTNEVLMKYYLRVRVDSEIPVNVILTSEDGTELKLTDGRTEEYELLYNERMRTKYHIKIEWNENDDSYEYAGKDVKLIVDLIATQVVEE